MARIENAISTDESEIVTIVLQQVYVYLFFWFLHVLVLK